MLGSVHEQPRLSQEFRLASFAHPAFEYDLSKRWFRAYPRGQMRFFWAVSGDDKAAAGVRRDTRPEIEQQVEPLVRSEPAQREEHGHRRPLGRGRVSDSRAEH